MLGDIKRSEHLDEEDLAQLNYLLNNADDAKLAKLAGDANGDGKVDEDDLKVVKKIVANACGIDANGDGVVDENDFAALRDYFAGAELKNIRNAVSAVNASVGVEDVAALRKVLGAVMEGGKL